MPGIARWPGHIPSGSQSGQVVLTVDWAASMVALAGGSAPSNRPFDGIDVLPILTGKTPARQRTVFWRRSLDPYRKNVKPHRAVRQGDWKYIDEPSGSRYLYNLSDDVAERVNLAQSKPEKAAAMARLLDDWEADVDPPLYDQRPKRRGK